MRTDPTRETLSRDHSPLDSPGALIIAAHGSDMNTHPSRIVCLSAETAETLCLLDEGDRIVGLSGPVGRLPDTQQRKPRLSVHTDTCVERICALEADLVLGSGQKHADVLAALAQRGIAVHLFSQA